MSVVGFFDSATYMFLFVALYFEVFLVISFLQKRTPKSKPNAAYCPSVTIVVPCYNEEAGLAGTIQSLRALDYPTGKLDIIIVNDGSTDGTREIAESLATNVFPVVQVFHKENGGKHTAMNIGLAHAKGEVIGSLDADSEVAPWALKNGVIAFHDPRVAGVTPGIHSKQPTNFLQHAQDAEYRLSIFNRYILAVLGSAFCTPGPFSLLRTSVVRELGGWRFAHSTEDMELALRIQEAGHIIANAPKATVYTGTPKTIRALFRQRVRWTYGFLRNAFDYRRLVGDARFGNLGVFIFPMAILMIFSAIFFYVRLIYVAFGDALDTYNRVSLTQTLPTPQFDVFYLYSGSLAFIVIIAFICTLVLISLGSRLGRGHYSIPFGTPLFVALYFLLAPIWLTTAATRAFLRTGVRWK